jgi:hypothetical protein
LIAHISKWLHREILVLDFGFLHTKDIWLLFLKPISNDSQSGTDGIGIKSGKLHKIPPEEAANLFLNAMLSYG